MKSETYISYPGEAEHLNERLQYFRKNVLDGIDQDAIDLIERALDSTDFSLKRSVIRVVHQLAHPTNAA